MEIKQYFLQSSQLRVEVLNIGAVIRQVLVTDKHGVTQNIVLGFEALAGYRTNLPYVGAIVGRTAGRVVGGRFSIDGVDYQLDCNNNGNNLHGGAHGFSHQFFDVEQVSEAELVLRYASSDNEGGYPGNVQVEIRYSLRNENELHHEYCVRTDKDTIVDLTNHTYFNLFGGASGTGLQHYVKIPAQTYVMLATDGVISGERAPVVGTSRDFTEYRQLSENLQLWDEQDEQNEHARGYDVFYLLDEPTACLYAEATGIEVSLWTDQVGVGFYNAGYFTDDMQFIGRRSEQFLGIAIEPQGVPNAINFADFPQPIVRAGDVYQAKTIWHVQVND